MKPASQTTDSELLQRYEKEANEAAFRELVERYQAMVLGTAFRRSGNGELAREVAQEVFAALARKAKFLIGRSSIGGWLHQAAIYQSARVLQSEVRRHARDERYSQEMTVVIPPARGGETAEQLAIVDEALDVLSAADREALVLHYFQDLSYPEMAKVLGVNEPAVRQRVSRALDRLGRHLRDRGVKGNVVLLLLSAVAIQSTVAAPPALASAALATAAAGGGYSAYLVLTALLSHGVTKTAAVLLALAGMTALVHEAVSHKSPSSSTQFSESTNPSQNPLYASFSEAQATSSTDNPFASTSPVTAGRDEKWGRYEKLAAAPTFAANSYGSPANLIAPAKKQGAAPSSLGSTTNPPQSPVPGAAPAQPKPVTTRKPDTPNSANPADIGDSGEGGADSPVPAPADPDFHFPGVLGELADAGGLAAVIDELRRVELVPHEAAALYGELLQDVLALEPLQRTRVEQFLEDHYKEMMDEGIAGVRPPEVNVGEWKIRRKTSISEAVDGVKDVLADVAPDTKIVSDVLTLVEKQDADADSSSSAPIAETVSDVIETTVGSTIPKLTAPLKLPLGR